MTTPRDALAVALADIDRQVERCIVLAQADGLSADERAGAAAAAVGAYEVADQRVESLLSHILTAGGCPGLLAELSAAADRAAERGAGPMGARARAVAEHARSRALSREQQVIAEVALPWWHRRLGVAL